MKRFVVLFVLLVTTLVLVSYFAFNRSSEIPSTFKGPTGQPYVVGPTGPPPGEASY